MPTRRVRSGVVTLILKARPYGISIIKPNEDRHEVCLFYGQVDENSLGQMDSIKMANAFVEGIANMVALADLECEAKYRWAFSYSYELLSRYMKKEIKTSYICIEGNKRLISFHEYKPRVPYEREDSERIY